MNSYTKAIIGAAVPLITALSSYVTTKELNAPEFALLALGLLNAVVVYAVRNQGVGVKRMAKFIDSALAPLVTALVSAWVTRDSASAEWVTLLTGLLTSVLVYLVQNSPDHRV